jgi:ubiquitin-like protein Pup
MRKTTVQAERRPPTTIPTERNTHDAELVDDMGALLDEIDEVLEENALEVTRTYRQKGGE